MDTQGNPAFDMDAVRATLLNLYRTRLEESGEYLLASEAWVQSPRLLEACTSMPGVRESLRAAAIFAERAQHHRDAGTAACYRESLVKIRQALGEG